MTVKLVWRTDVHLSDRAPVSRTDDWAETVFGKLDQVRKVAVKVGANAILDGGDFFHIKSPGRNSHELVRRTVEHHTDYPCPVYCTPGNHDSVYGDYSFLPQQPLGVLFASGTFNRLYDEHEAVFEAGGTKVRVVGIPYHGTRYDMERFRSIKKGDEDVLVCVAHVLASKKGGKMFEGEDIVKYKDLLDTAPDVFLFGHWHKDQGIVEMGDKTFINIGSLTRGALSQDEVQRRPACVVLGFNGDAVTTQTVRLRVGAPEDVFDIEKRQHQEQRQMEMDTFVASVKDSLVGDQNSIALPDVIGSMEEVRASVRERALLYLEQSAQR
jgi:DNA repair exonuclease SbcCD nuclease subunit